MVKQGEAVADAALVDGSQTSLHSHPGGGGGGLIDKSGIVNTGGGNEVAVTFNTPYSDTNYFIVLTAGQSNDAIIVNMKTGTKTVSGFTVITMDDGGKAENGVDVYWATGPYSNP